MPYMQPQTKPTPQVERADTDHHIGLLLAEWWSANLPHMEDTSRQTELVRIIRDYISRGSKSVLSYKDLNTFIEKTPVDKLDFKVLHLMVNELLPAKDHLESYNLFRNAIKIVLVVRRGMDEGMYNTIFKD